MNYVETIKESTTTLLLNKMRTGLAVLGIVIGIASVIALLSIGEASQQSITNSINSLGVNLLTINPGAPRSSGLVRGAMGGGTTLTYDDSLVLSADESLSAIKTVAPVYSSRSQVVYGENNTNTTITGVTPEYAGVRNITIETGSFLTSNDVTGITNVAVLGPTAVESLFGEETNNSDLVGKVIRIGSLNFNIIGITKEKGSSGMNNQDDVIYIPISTAQKKVFGVKHISSILVEATSADVMTMATNQIGYTLLAQHKIEDPTKADFNISNSADMLETVSSVTGTLTSLLSGVAAISLLVGGIGIMNIMLVTVTERTREIGLRKALGAKDKVIITQFLTEAMVLTFVGGIVGILVGIILAYMYSKIQSSLFVISTTAIGLAFLVSAVIGLVFGWYPAKRASLLQPIEALRYE